jgi:hypothetical protein
VYSRQGLQEIAESAQSYGRVAGRRGGFGRHQSLELLPIAIIRRGTGEGAGSGMKIDLAQTLGQAADQA